MQSTTSRRRLFSAASVMIVVVIAFGGVAYYVMASKGNGGNPATSSVTCGTVTLSAIEVSSTNCQLGLTFALSVKNGTAKPETNVIVVLSVRNDLSSNNTAKFTGAPTLPGGLVPSSPESSVYLLPSPGCNTSASGYIAVYNSSDAPLQLNDNPPNLACGISGPADLLHQFYPHQTVNQTIDLGGYYHSSNVSEPWLNAKHAKFTSGQQYTVVAFDGWGQTLTLNFTAA